MKEKHVKVCFVVITTTPFGRFNYLNNSIKSLDLLLKNNMKPDCITKPSSIKL